MISDPKFCPKLKPIDYLEVLIKTHSWLLSIEQKQIFC